MLRFCYVIFLFGVIHQAAHGDVPTQINHQGVVSVNGQRFHGNGEFYFAIIDPSSGNSVWTNDGSNVRTRDRPRQEATLSCANGVNNVRLGDTVITNMTPVEIGVFSSTMTHYLILVNVGAFSFVPLAPRKKGNACWTTSMSF